MKYAERNKYTLHEDSLRIHIITYHSENYWCKKKKEQHVLSSVLVSMGPAIARNNQYKI
jgi:hypothetical protein